MGLIVPGFIPSTLHEIVEYSPSLIEWKVTAGIWAFGLMAYTLAVKIAKAVFAGVMHVGGERQGGTRRPAAAKRHVGT
jgi:molybdopterin-containing oxidoreductase family membrane subunit